MRGHGWRIHLEPERNHACIPIPMEATDFTLIDGLLDFIEYDDLKTTLITLKTASIMDEIQVLSWFAMLQNRLPVLAIMAKMIGLWTTTKSGNSSGICFPVKIRIGWFQWQAAMPFNLKGLRKLPPKF